MLTGIGLGTLMPILVTIAHEAAPPKHKGLFVTLLVTAFPFGSFVGGLGVAWGLEHASWRDVFLVSGIIAAIFPVLFWFFLWPAPLPPSTATTPRKTNVVTLFQERRWIGTLLLWALFFTTLFNTYMLGAWMPLLLQRGGIDAVDAVRVTASVSLGGTIGGIVLGLIAGRFGGVVLAVAYIVAAAALIVIGLADGALLITALATFVVGAMIPGGHVGNNVIAARVYPPAMNATGVGWAQGLGRVGCVVGPASVGVAVGWDVSNAVIFAGAACVAVLGAVAAMGIAIYERRQQ
jgi:AAHS family 4-hydroxybenzoate transporter-like MFS transporter